MTELNQTDLADPAASPTHTGNRRAKAASPRRRPGALLGLGLGVAVAGLSAQHAGAATQTWDAGAGTQDWNTAANWTNDTFPNDSTSDAYINTSTGLYPIVSADPVFTPRDFRIGFGASQAGRLDHTAGSLSTFGTGDKGNWFWVGRDAGTGTYNLADTSGTGGTLTGFAQGSGNLTVGKLWIGGGFNFNGTGTVNVNTSGTINANSTENYSNHGGVSLIVGTGGGNGTLNIDNGTVNAAGIVDVASAFSSGQATQGTLNIGSGGTLNTAGDFRTAYAGSASALATVNLSGGTLNVGSTTKRWVHLGHFDNGSSTVTVSAGNLNLNANSDIRFKTAGGAGTHIVNLNNGAITSFSDNHTTANGTGVVDLMNAASTANNTFNLNGGTLTIAQVMTTNNGSTATFNFNGGTLRATGASANFVDLGGASQNAYIKAGGAFIDANGFGVTIPQALLTDPVSTGGGLTKTGTGTLTLASANTYTGATTVENGTLALGAVGTISDTLVLGKSGGSSGGLDLTAKASFSQANLSGNGTINIGTGKTLAVTGSVAPGFSAGSISVTGDVALDSTTAMTMELAGGGGVAGTDFDFIAASGTFTYGGSLSIVGSGGYNINQPGTYDLVDFATDAGGLTTVLFGGNALAETSSGSGVWTDGSATFTESTGVLQVVPEPAALMLMGFGAMGLRRRRS